MSGADAVKKFKDLLENNETYKMTGEMEIISNEESYHYNVEVDYKEGAYYKASLLNKDNAHEQIILKNESGVYVINPSLNKSFKFQSDWPNNSSQAYILESLLKDIENDSNIIFEQQEETCTITSTVNYPNNSQLLSQKITFDKDMMPKEVEVYNKEGIANITFKITSIDLDAKFEDDYFNIENSVCKDCTANQTKETSSIDEVLYPMYLPSGTTFKSEETVKTEESERVILTFAGDKSFIMIEETTNIPKEFEIESSSGELVFYENILGGMTDTSLTWTMNGKDYYIIGKDLSNEELLKVASSTQVVSSLK